MRKNFQKNRNKLTRSATLLALLGLGELLPLESIAASPSTDFGFSTEFQDAASQIYNVVIGIIIISAILMIIIGGYTLVFSVGRPELVTKGKKQITGAIIGLVIGILSAVYLNFLNPGIFK